MNNILIINCNVRNDNGLEKVLTGEKFNVVVVRDDLIPADIPKDFHPDIIICHSDGIHAFNSSIFDQIGKYNPAKDKPVVFVSPVTDPGQYLKALESNIVHHISTPCSSDYLTSKLNRIIIEDKKSINSGPSFALKFRFNDNDYNISLTQENINNLIISLIENNVQQNIILNNIVFKNNRIACISKNSEILENKFICPETDDVYEKGIFDAFDNNEFRLMYQPVISIKDNKIHGFEALIRWEKNKVIIYPDEFIPVLENSMLITKLGNWIAHEASRQLREWQEELDFDKRLYVNINLSPKQFEDPNLCENIFNIVTKNGISPGNIGIEVTESVLMGDTESANLILLQFKSRGFNLYMDDFGTGYSSLSYLLNFPFNIMKIDKSFVQWMHFDKQSEEIVRSVVALAHNLSKFVVAEGVELKEHLAILKEIRCDFWQGYLFSEPLDNLAAVEMIKKFF